MTTRMTATSLLLAHIFSLLGFSTYAVALTRLQEAWALTNSESGWIASGFFIGYVVSVSLWSSLTDHVDARRIYALGSLIAALGSLGFAWIAHGFYSALFFQMLLGIGNAATYMPGLKILSDRTEGRTQSRFVAFYTAFFGLGVASSLLLTGFLLPRAGIPATFAWCGLGPMVAALIVLTQTRPLAKDGVVCSHGSLGSRLFPFETWRRVLRDRECLSFTLGYGVHCTELFGSRAWIVSFLAFSFGTLEPAQSLLSASSTAAVINILSAPASIIGNEIAIRIGRRTWIHWVMPLTTLLGILMAMSAGASWLVMLVLSGLYSMLVMADSATLTAGLVASAEPRIRGAAMGLYSLMGFGLGGVMGPAIVGGALDLAGGQGAAHHWALAFGLLGLGCLVFPLLDRVLHRVTNERDG